MQIAKVVPKVKTSGEGIFDYSIPPAILPDIKIGLLVVVPFHGRKVEGIVIDIKRSSQILNLKPIISVIDNIPVVDTTHIELAKWMADYYLTDFSKCLFENIVPPAKRTIKKQSDVGFDTKKRSANQSAKKYLIVADFQTRLKFYLQAIKKTLARGQQVIILVPDLSLIPYFTKYIKNKVAILHAGLTLTQRWLEWDKIRRGDADIVIGSNSALFAPVQNLGLIIIDQEENETYKSGQAPRYHAVKVAEQLSRLTAARLVLGSLTPRVEKYYDATQNKYLFAKQSKLKPNIQMVDMNFERSILSQPLQNKIIEILEINQRVLLVLNRKNTLGLTTSKLEKIVKEVFPQIEIARFEKDNEVNLTNNWNIAIVTNFALKLNLPKIGLVSIMDADQDLNFPDFRASEKTFQMLYKFLRLTKEGIIQTHLPENLVLSALANFDYEKFFLNEIASRQKFNFPPFTHLTRLLYRATSEPVVEKETQTVVAKMKEIASPKTEILGPTPTFTQKQRGYFYEQIVIKSYKRDSILDDFIRHLPKGWVIDIDPFDLL